MRAILSIAACFCLAGCAAPGRKYYTKVDSRVATAGEAGKKADVERQTTKPIYVEGSNIIGDQKLTIAANGAISHTITTPRAADGSFLIEEIPILNKARTAVIGYHKRPMVASVDTVSAIVAWGDFGRKLFSGFNNMLGTLAMWFTGMEAAKQTGAVGAAAVEAIR